MASDGGARPSDKPSPRKGDEIVRDIDAERTELHGAIDSLRAEVQATKEKLLSPRTLGTVGGALLGLIILRRIRRRHR
jgi:hypothetical protein